MAKALTTRFVDTVKPTDKRQEIPDGLVPGTNLTVEPSGKRAYYLRSRISGKPFRMRLGGHPQISLAEARQLARDALRSVAEGRDPRKKRGGASEQAMTVETAVERFLDRHRGRGRKARTTEELHRMFALHILPSWRGRALQDIRRADVHDAVDRLADAGKKVSANRLVSTLNAFFDWCVSRDLIPTSPAAGIRRPYAEKPRDRVLNDLELAAVWQAATDLGAPFGSMVKLLILSGQRRTEVARMTWDEIDREARLWRLPSTRTKNQRAHTIRVTDAMLQVLDGQPRFQNCAFVFSRDGMVCAANYDRGKKALDKLLPPGMTTWRLHDLRRSFASGLARLGVALHVIERILNHRSGSFAGIVSVYQHHQYEAECAAALNLWSQHVAGADVVPLRRIG